MCWAPRWPEWRRAGPLRLVRDQAQPPVAGRAAVPAHHHADLGGDHAARRARRHAVDAGPRPCASGQLPRRHLPPRRWPPGRRPPATRLNGMRCSTARRLPVGGAAAERRRPAHSRADRMPAQTKTGAGPGRRLVQPAPQRARSARHHRGRPQRVRESEHRGPVHREGGRPRGCQGHLPPLAEARRPALDAIGALQAPLPVQRRSRGPGDGAQRHARGGRRRRRRRFCCSGEISKLADGALRGDDARTAPQVIKVGAAPDCKYRRTAGGTDIEAALYMLTGAVLARGKYDPASIPPGGEAVTWSPPRWA